MASAALAPGSPPVLSPSMFCKTPPFSPQSVPSQIPLLTLRPRASLRRHDRESSALERERPPMISIPVRLFKAIPLAVVPGNKKEEDKDEYIVDEGDGYGVYSKRGKKRGRLEDRYTAILGRQGDSDQAFFGVFDGHGGAKAAEFAAKNIGENIAKHARKRRNAGLEEAVRKGYLQTDAEFTMNKEEGEDVYGGSCCVTALLGKTGDLIVSNVGDCRAVLCRAGTAEALTSDHKASVAGERERIEKAGGYVDCCNGVWRVQGSLAVSRSIGDRHLKRWVTAEPETRVLRMKHHHEFLILASDGLWDKVTDQEAVDAVRSSLTGSHRPNPFSAAKELAELSAARGSADDITVMVIKLDQFISQVESI
ncbi:hypothetical protein SAY86_027025 [Trapa natans]|uniref:protein-serine/threonine phosphatase n=1 Tax=Trapa natans TaxID=22666 RepID=A0AAN7QLN5_TRANT|nr:hypothetical protein SAY86_027025 [Trapa natans]